MTKILSGDSVSDDLLNELRQWFELEWGQVDSFYGNHPEVDVPLPVVAVDEDGSLLGGLVFSSFTNPLKDDVAVWINAVIVSPEQRKHGIASKLVRRAEVEAGLMAINELFVLSEYPGLYEKLGWGFVSLDESRDSTVLTKLLGSA